MRKVQQVLSRLAEDVISLYDDFDDGKITLREYQEELHNLIVRYEERVYAEIQEDYMFHHILGALKKYKKEVS